MNVCAAELNTVGTPVAVYMDTAGTWLRCAPSMRSKSERKSEVDRAYIGPERRLRVFAEDVEPVFLTRKYAETIDGVELVGCAVGDRLPLHPRAAHLLIAEGWARPTTLEQRRRRARRDSDE